jgi:hypothetical protein
MADAHDDHDTHGPHGGRGAHDLLVAELVDLGRSVPLRPVDETLVRRIAAEVETATAPAARRTAPSRRLQAVVAAVVAVLVGALAAPPVRAAVAELFGFGGVLVREEPGPAPSTAPPPPGATADPTTGRTLAEAADLVPFTPVAPAALGRPDGVEVSADRRVLSLTWQTEDGTVRLDQIGGRLDYAFAKSATGVEFVTVAGEFALWFPDPHEVVALEPDGTERRETARLAGHTLIWERGTVTMRLEGDLTQERAVALAESVRDVSD